MAATSSGALKAYVESLGLGISAYRDQAPPGAPRPYITITEAISLVFDPLETGGAQSAKEQVQVDVWQQYRDPDTRTATESLTLVPALVRALQGGSLPASPTTVYSVRVQNVVRMVDIDNNLVRAIITVGIRRVT